jgi:transcriptional regulator with XRE-family HTH domain
MNIHCGEKLQAAMARKGCSGVELARRLKITPQQISRWRRQQNFGIKRMVEICEALDMDISEFLA